MKRKKNRETVLGALRAGVYDATRDGRVLSHHGRCRELKTVLSTTGYVKFHLRIGGKSVHVLGHVVVWLRFNGSFDSDVLQINHKDCDKTNNALNNLELVTRLENAQHAVKAGRYLQGEGHPRAKLTATQAVRLRSLWLEGAHTTTDLGDLFGISRGAAHKIATGVSKYALAGN